MPSGSVEPVPLKFTAIGSVLLDVGLAVATAVGGLLLGFPVKLMRWMLPPSRST